MTSTLLPLAENITDWMVELRRTLHRHPELMYEEVETSKLVQATLAELGIEYRAGIARTGVLAHIGNGDGPCVALRADMDALPIHEEADVEFKSAIDGKMHACGHDCHTAMLLGAARLLKEQERDIHGTVKLLFQPAEEGGAGGQLMSDEGALDNPVVERVFGLHVWPSLPTGQMAARTGVLLAAAGQICIRVNGLGGHAAMPHMTRDPVAAAAKIVVEMQTIVARELNPMTPGVVSFTAMNGGEAYNVIPPSIELRGTVRALTMDDLAFLQGRVRDIATTVAEANRCTAEVEFPGHDYPPTINDATCWNVARELGVDLLGDDNVSECPPIMGGEDFAFYTQRVPGCFVFIGSGNESIGATYSVHHPKFIADENVLPLGTALHVAFALRSLDELRE